MIRLRALLVGLVAAVFGLLQPVRAQELPKPSYLNSTIIGVEHSIWDSQEVARIKAGFNFGLYAWLSMSHNHLAPNLAWHSDWSRASQNMASQKDLIDSMIARAKTEKVAIHIVLCSGLARNLGVYAEAKEEDVRNCQWYFDNRIAGDSQIGQPDLWSTYAFGSLSRYARKVRSNLEAKSRALLSFLKQRMDENPDLLITVSGWGEAELNFHRIDDGGSLFFCDYSSFAVMEFRDWIQRSGLYDDASGQFRGEGYPEGLDADGTPKYRGPAGLARFNADFGTGFSDWGLRYFDWSLGDDYDPVPQDSVNPDPHRIPFSAYVQGGMTPASGPSFIAGGFDPPRARTPGNHFWELWDRFRKTMVRHFVSDAARWALESGIPSDRFFSHQLPADYLFGFNPSTCRDFDRYITSASPLWTADNRPYGSAGVTVFDIKLSETWFLRTSDYLYPDIRAMSPNWAILEFDPETYPDGFAVSQSAPEFILNQYLRAYDHDAHLISFFRWIDGGEHQVKGMNKEIALRDFILRIRDKARNTGPGFSFSPPRIAGLSAEGEKLGEGVYRAASAEVRLLAPAAIWSGERWAWTDWGDFLQFRIYRGFRSDFVADADSLIGQTAGISFVDIHPPPGTSVFYRWRAENRDGVLGPASDALEVRTLGTPAPWITLDVKSLAFDEEIGTPSTAVRRVRITNDGAAGSVLNWQASSNRPWILLVPPSGTGEATVDARVDFGGLGAGTYSGQITILDPAAANSPQLVQVILNVYNQIAASLSVQPSSLAFSVELGKTSADQTVAVANVGTPGTVLHWSASADQAWIGLDPLNGAGDGSLKVRASGLSVGDFSGRITVADPAALDSPRTIDVSVRVTPPPAPALSLERGALIFGGEEGKASSAVQKVLIQNAGSPGTILRWQASADASWIRLNTASGTGGVPLEIRVDPTFLAKGSYTGRVQIQDPAAGHSPQTITVSLNVYAPGTDSAPFGYFDTPAEGACVAANIPVTGWALDDIEVTKIEIWRDPVPTAGEINELHYIGDAVCVKNARPDIEAAHPLHPAAYGAGWGYMLLTNFLPNRGNGTYILHVFAFDGSGHRTELGQKTIVSDNAHSILPFGTLDTPAQGGTASGKAYINWGWALTPLPNAIPSDGSTIWVWVDGLPLGHPVYGNSRADIAGLFPEYLNADEAVGYFYLDTTKYVNGTHAISWGLTDNAGHESGIGSRYFEVVNVEGGASPQNPPPAGLAEDSDGKLEIGLEGPADIEVQELGRVVVRLRAKGGSRFLGWGETPERTLPIGSTLDEITGVFSWIPGPGFLGRHVLHFAVTDGFKRSRSVEIVVRIAPRRYDLKTDLTDRIRRR